MKYIQSFLVVFTLSLLTYCGGDDTREGEEEVLVPEQVFQPLSTLTITDSLPDNGNGHLAATSIRNSISPNGGENTLIVEGTTDGEAIQHLITIKYVLYFETTGGQLMEQKARVTTVTHSWGSDLANVTTDGGISLCDESCEDVLIYPSQHTAVFSNAILGETANTSTFHGAVIYP